MNVSKLKKWLWFVFVLTLFSFFLFYGINKIKDKKERDKNITKIETPVSVDKTRANKKAKKGQITTSKTLVKVREVTINLTSSYEEENSVYLNNGQVKQIADFENATVAFCVKNRAGQEVCGEAYSNPDLPVGSNNSKLWFKSRDGLPGTVTVIIYDIIIQTVQVQ